MIIILVFLSERCKDSVRPRYGLNTARYTDFVNQTCGINIEIGCCDVIMKYTLYLLFFLSKMSVRQYTYWNEVDRPEKKSDAATHTLRVRWF